MKVLVDTHLLLWAAAASSRLTKAVYNRLNDPGIEPISSVVSLWEIVIKSSLGRKDFQVDALRLRDGLKRNGWKELDIRADHVLAVATLPPLHRDPFDRLLLAQAQREQVPLLTSDKQLAQYGKPVELL
ncbi:MAG: type II toxin-antitoxin system VapC family toxin [Pseudomonadota bacterium]